MSKNDFELFKQALELYEQETTKSNTLVDTSCEHTNIITEKGISTCEECGEELERALSFDKEYRFNSPSEMKNVADPNIVNISKTEDRSIYKDVENLGFSETIIAKANKIYTQITNGKIFRGESRKGIVYGCIFRAYLIYATPIPHEKLTSLFKIKEKVALKGLKMVNNLAPRDSEIRIAHIKPFDLIDNMMEIFNASKKQIEEVKSLYTKIENHSSNLNRSYPQSVAAGLIYYWIKQKKKDISLKNFSSKINLSELTITKICVEIERVFEKRSRRRSPKEEKTEV